MPRPKAEILEELAAVSAELQRAELLARQRDELVVEATRADASRSEVGKAAGVSRGRIQQIVTEARKEAGAKKRRTQTGLAVIALVAGLGAVLALSFAGDDAEMKPALREAALTVAEVRNSDVDLFVEWLATVTLRNERSSFDARTLKFACNGITSEAARSMSSLLKQPITAESLSELDAKCLDTS